MQIHQQNDSSYTLDQQRMSLTHFNAMIQIPNSPNATHHSHLTLPSVRKTAPSLNKTLHLLNRSNSAFSFALLSAHSSTLHTTPASISSLLSENFPKPALSPALGGSLVTYAAVPTMPLSSTLIAHLILFMRSVYRTVLLVLPSQFSLMPVGKTALILVAPPLAI